MTIDEIKKLRENITPGEWRVYENLMKDGKLSVGVCFAKRENNENIGSDYINYVCSIGQSLGAGVFEHETENALLIAALPQIADECIRLAEENERLKRMQSLIKDGLQEGIDVMRKAREKRESSI